MRGLPRAACSALALLGALAQAQTAAPAAATEPAPYQDRVIEGLAPLADDSATPDDYNRSGAPRFLRLEARLGTQPFDAARRTQTAYALYGLVETPNHGVLSIDGSLVPGESRQSLSLRQRQLPLPGGWVGHHELGVIGTPAPGLARRASRVQLPSASLLGLRGEWEHAASGVSLLAAGGEPGQLTSLPASGFQGLGGRRSVLGAQWHVGGAAPGPGPIGADVIGAVANPNAGQPGVTLALMHERASGTTPSGAPAGADTTADASATLLALRHEGEDLRTQAHLVQSSSPGTTTPRGQGVWIDSEWDEGPRRHGLALYRLEPGLSWAGQALPSDLQGAGLRSQWNTRQWSVEGSYDWLRTLSGRAGGGSYASASARWRLSRFDQINAGFSARRFDGNAWSGFLDWRTQTDWGHSGLRLQLASSSASGSGSPTHEISYDQEWLVPAGFTLSTSLGLGRYAAATAAGSAGGRYTSAALAGSAPLGSNAGLRGNLLTEQGSNGQRRHSLNLGADWRLNRHWTLEGNLTRALGRSQRIRSLDPLAPIPGDTETLAQSDRSVYAVLRYETQAGSRSIPLGGRAQGGGGRIQGTVYFDANRSGTQDASETGAPGVTVYLGNRYAVRTDPQGRFEFPFVAPGPTDLTVRNDTLPLPWGVVDDGQVRITVTLRGTTQVNIPVQRSD